MSKPVKLLLPSLLAFFSASTAYAYDINDIQRASSAAPAFTNFASPQDVYEYDLKVENLCDKPGSLTTVTNAWVGPKRENWDFIASDKSVALAAVVTFPNARADQVKQVKVPLLAKTNFGDALVQNCDGTIITDVPANAKMKLHFEFKRSSTYRFNDPSKFIGGLTKVASSAASLGAIGSGAAVVGASIVPVVSYVEKNLAPITALNTGVNEIMESFSEVKSPDPKQYEISSIASKISYKSGRAPVITIIKIAKDGGPDVNGLNGWPGVAAAFSTRYGSLTDQFNNAQNAVDAPWANNLPKFCSKLRSYIDGATKGDRVATALGIGFHAFYNSTEYNGKTCLNSWEVAKLKQRNFAPPYPDAWPRDPATTPVAVAAPAPRRSAANASRLAYAGLR
jgi:hypothetical protein